MLERPADPSRPYPKIKIKITRPHQRHVHRWIEVKRILVRIAALLPPQPGVIPVSI
jgi:hypothetical protein